MKKFLKNNFDIIGWLIIIIFVIPFPDGKEVEIDKTKQDLSVRHRTYSIISDPTDPHHKRYRWFFYVLPPIGIIYNRIKRKKTKP